MSGINDIISSLSNDDIEMLKGVASSILGGANGGESVNSPLQASPPATSNALSTLGGLNLNPDDLQMMLKAKQIFEKMNNTSSKNADLILALKPHLSAESQHKADQAIRILKLFDILPYLKDLF